MKNSLSDLNNHLFAQLERLSDESLKGEELKEEMDRSKVITGLAAQVILNAKVVLDAQEHLHGVTEENRPDVLKVCKK